MLKLAGKSKYYPIIAAVLTLAVFGAFAFSMTEIPHYTVLGGNKPYSTGIFTPIEHTVDWLAENIPTVSRVNKASSSIFRNGLPRLLMPIGIYNVAEFWALSIITIKPNYFPNSKNTIHLNLRI